VSGGVGIRRLAGIRQTGNRATDDGWRVLIPEMLQGFFKKINSPS
jgi:hypothetical protein